VIVPVPVAYDRWIADMRAVAIGVDLALPEMVVSTPGFSVKFTLPFAIGVAIWSLTMPLKIVVAAGGSGRALRIDANKIIASFVTVYG
jgi:hypothetical protein